MSVACNWPVMAVLAVTKVHVARHDLVQPGRGGDG